MISRKASRMVKDNISEKKRKYNVSLVFSNDTNTNKLNNFLAENKQDVFWK